MKEHQGKSGEKWQEEGARSRRRRLPPHHSKHLITLDQVPLVAPSIIQAFFSFAPFRRLVHSIHFVMPLHKFVKKIHQRRNPKKKKLTHCDSCLHHVLDPRKIFKVTEPSICTHNTECASSCHRVKARCSVSDSLGVNPFLGRLC